MASFNVTLLGKRRRWRAGREIVGVGERENGDWGLGGRGRSIEIRDDPCLNARCGRFAD